MADIFHTFPINAPLQEVFEAFSTPNGLDAWWTKHSSGKAEANASYQLYFSEEYNWKGIVTKCVPQKEFEISITEADEDWVGTRVGVILNQKKEFTEVCFYHSGWSEANEHFKISSFCWAMYLRILKRYVENKEHIPYEDRLNV